MAAETGSLEPIEASTPIGLVVSLHADIAAREQGTSLRRLQLEAAENQVQFLGAQRALRVVTEGITGHQGLPAPMLVGIRRKEKSESNQTFHVDLFEPLNRDSYPDTIKNPLGVATLQPWHVDSQNHVTYAVTVDHESVDNEATLDASTLGIGENDITQPYELATSNQARVREAIEARIRRFLIDADPRLEEAASNARFSIDGRGEVKWESTPNHAWAIAFDWASQSPDPAVVDYVAPSSASLVWHYVDLRLTPAALSAAVRQVEEQSVETGGRVGDTLEGA